MTSRTISGSMSDRESSGLRSRQQTPRTPLCFSHLDRAGDDDDDDDDDEGPASSGVAAAVAEEDEDEGTSVAP